MTLEMVNELGDIRSVLVKERPPVERVRPLQAGEWAPFFSLIDTATYWKASVSTTHLPAKALSLTELVASKPLVVSFYCPCWGAYARPFLTALTKLAIAVRDKGGQLVVFSNEDPRYLLNQTDLSGMHVIYDADNAVARQFGVYSETDPIWDRVSGISEDVYVPAVYVINRFRRITYHFLDENFEGFDYQAEVVEALPHKTEPVSWMI